MSTEPLFQDPSTGEIRTREAWKALHHQQFHQTYTREQTDRNIDELIECGKLKPIANP